VFIASSIKRIARAGATFRLACGLALLLSIPVCAAGDCPYCPERVAVPAGRFVMGAAPGEEERGGLAEGFRGRSQPRRSVAVKAFSIGKFEVTRGQYRVFAEATGRRDEGCFVWRGAAFELDPHKNWRDPGYAQDDTHPVTCVSWEDAGAYVAWLNQRTGGSYRLPTEAEWEYAARAGTTATRYWGDDVAATCDYANGADRSTTALVPGAGEWPIADCDDRHAWTAPVGRYRPNPFGLHDMLGNLEEWTQDCWNGDYRGAPGDGGAAVAGDCSQRAVRGGSWLDAPVGVTAAYRVGSPATIRVFRRGFRVAAD
jgi:formylglycine-generating enzyme